MKHGRDLSMRCALFNQLQDIDLAISERRQVEMTRWDLNCWPRAHCGLRRMMHSVTKFCD
jgi:hypothetical protein